MVSVGVEHHVYDVTTTPSLISRMVSVGVEHHVYDVTTTPSLISRMVSVDVEHHVYDVTTTVIGSLCSCITLVVALPCQALLYQSFKVPEVIQQLLAILAQNGITHNPVIAHVFSNAGCLMYSRFSAALHDSRRGRPGHGPHGQGLRLCLKGVVLDSGPSRWSVRMGVQSAMIVANGSPLLQRALGLMMPLALNLLSLLPKVTGDDGDDGDDDDCGGGGGGGDDDDDDCGGGGGGGDDDNCSDDGVHLRTIDDVIDYLNMSDKAGYLLALDYCKAFDSVSKDFIIEAF